MSGALIKIFALACGLAVANLYYAQPLLDIIGRTFHVDHAMSGLIVSVTQVGYVLGMIFVVPLGDLLENRRLITTIFLGTILALLAAAWAPTYPAFLAAALAIGVTSVVAQVLVPFAAHLAAPEERGRVVGQVVSGLLLGILLARAVAGIVSGAAGWRAVYVLSAVLLAGMTIVLRRVLPLRKPDYSEGYGALVASLGRIYRAQPILRRRAAYQAAMFGTFSAFWTSITFLLAGPHFHFSEVQIGLFSLAGASGALFAPIAGRLGDAGYGKIASGAAFLIAAAGVALTLIQTQLWALIAGAILIDLAVQATLVLGQQAIFALDPAERSRLNTLYLATFFTGGALCSGLSAFAYARMGWDGVVLLGGVLPLLALAFWFTDREPRLRQPATSTPSPAATAT